MNKLFLKLFSASLFAILVAVIACTLILWAQWHPHQHFQMKRFIPPLLQTMLAELKEQVASQSTQGSTALELSTQSGAKIRLSQPELDGLHLLSSQISGSLSLQYIEDLDLAEGEKIVLREGGVITRLPEARYAYIQYDRDRALEVEALHITRDERQWFDNLLFIVEQPRLDLSTKLERIKTYLTPREEAVYSPLSAHEFSRIELNRLLVTPKVNLGFSWAAHSLQILHLPVFGEAKEPQIINVSFYFSATLLPPVVMLVLVVLFIAFILWMTLHPLTRKASELASVAQRFGRGDLNVRAELSGTDPVDQIAYFFNQAADNIVQLVEGRERLFRAVSHELRTPISRLFFLVDMARLEQDTKQRNDVLDDVEDSLTELTRATDALLQYQRFCSSSFQFDKQPIELNEYMHKALRDAVELSSGIAFKTHHEEAWVQCDAPRFLCVIRNLLHNADRYGAEQICVSITTGTEQDIHGEDYDFADLIIDDDGPGISDTARTLIFDPFERVEESRSKDQGGLGLGLSIAQSVVHGHGGKLMVQSAPLPLGGARFIVRLPRYAHPLRPL